MNRRQFLELATLSSGFIAGCTKASNSETTESDTAITPSSNPSLPPTETRSPSPTESPTSNNTPRQNSDTIFVDVKSGADSNVGTKNRPLATIQEALDKATAGETIQVLPGEYREQAQTVRPGEPSKPISIVGPTNAVYRAQSFEINHSHVHLRGLTIDGLLDVDNPDEPASYSDQGVFINRALLGELEEMDDQPEAVADSDYLTDVVVKPHAIGNSLGALIKLAYSKNVEIGEFEIIGLAGAKYVKSDVPGHNGEIVYLGTPYRSPYYPTPDLSHGVHVHHIANIEGHPHSEVVNTKDGTSDILIEYCTDGGGSYNTEGSPSASVRIQGFHTTVRWCELRNGRGHGVEIGSEFAQEAQQAKPESELTEPERLGGTENEIYENAIRSYDDLAFSFWLKEYGQTPTAQRFFCGNSFDGSSHGDPDKECAEAVPTGDGLGHTGGDSPWS